jgi:ribosomal protein S18 acetylase RimI-like enzyme
MRIRAARASSDREIDLIASRMRLTLIEVLGEEAGTAMYSMDWLRDRVRFHLDPQRSTAAVLLAESDASEILGQSIVRIEPARQQGAEPRADEYGLMSTIYVVPEARRMGVAERLVEQVEAWIRERGLDRAATNTGKHNQKLICLFEKRGYEVTLRTEDMVQLSRKISTGG